MKEIVEKILKEEINPRLAVDGGSAEFVEITDDVVKIRFKGVCKVCPMAQMTLSQIVEKILKARIPQIKKVEVSD